MSALKLRRSGRAYSDRPLAQQTSSDLLWAAFGINRPSGDRTAPYWRHIVVIDVYAAMANGVWLYQPKAHTLLPYLPGDIRALIGQNVYLFCASGGLATVFRGLLFGDVYGLQFLKLL